jgi:hypothetical protein
MALGVAPSRLRALRSFRACCAPWGLGPYLSTHLRAPALTARTGYWLGEPLPHQQPDRVRPHPWAESEDMFLSPFE